MTPGDLISDNHDRSESACTEVQFALVIARMIDTIKNSPEDMRQAVYDLARYKLQEQFTYAEAKDIKRTQQALETAIRGVEEFSKQHNHTPVSALPVEISVPDVTALAPRRPPPSELIPQVRTRPNLEIYPKPNDAASKTTPLPWPYIRQAAGVFAVLVGLMVAVQQRERLAFLIHNLSKYENQSAPEEQRPPAQVVNNPTPEPSPVKPAPLRPTDYGVYAIGNDTLIELQQLPGRAPDIRVAISAALKIPSRPALPNGHPKFIVFRRDVASNIADRAEVRIIAKIAREFSADVIGKKPSEGDDTWVIRNVSFPFRSSPISDKPEMYELHSEDPALELTPGRYALILRNQAYDFSVDGKVVDPKHCIERVVASNGIFYSDCKKP